MTKTPQSSKGAGTRSSVRFLGQSELGERLGEVVPSEPRGPGWSSVKEGGSCVEHLRCRVSLQIPGNPWLPGVGAGETSHTPENDLGGNQRRPLQNFPPPLPSPGDFAMGRDELGNS